MVALGGAFDEEVREHAQAPCLHELDRREAEDVGHQSVPEPQHGKGDNDAESGGNDHREQEGCDHGEYATF